MSDQSPPASAPAQNATASRKRLMIFRAGEGTDIQDHMPILGVDDGVQAGLQRLAEATGPYPVASGAKTLMLFREPGEQGLSLCYIWFKSGYILPRHSHDADCLYYVLAGELHMGAQTLHKGDGMFIPANAGYTYEAGPDGVELLEFRNATRFHFMFRGNDDAHWSRIADVLKKNCPKWENEPPPSGRS
jgi:quercetin dioxygenase-like cupin family protein